MSEAFDSFHVSAVRYRCICRGQVVLRNPSNQQIANCLGFNESDNLTRVRDLVVIGGGPSGLAIPVYGASEGLDVLFLDQLGLADRLVQAQESKITGISHRYLRSRAGK